MPTARNLLQRKGDQNFIAALGPDAMVLEAAQMMNDRHTGSVLVTSGGRLAGIFTERDILRRVVAEQRDPAATRLADVMTTAVVCAALHTPLNEIRQVMRERRIRHLPVIEGNEVRGVISIGDLNQAEHDAQERTILYLEQYMSVT